MSSLAKIIIYGTEFYNTTLKRKVGKLEIPNELTYIVYEYSFIDVSILLAIHVYGFSFKSSILNTRICVSNIVSQNNVEISFQSAYNLEFKDVTREEMCEFLINGSEIKCVSSKINGIRLELYKYLTSGFIPLK